MKPPPFVVAALVEARGNRGCVRMVGPFGRGAYQALQLGLMEDCGRHAELNLRGMDIADEAIRLAKTITMTPALRVPL